MSKKKKIALQGELLRSCGKKCAVSRGYGCADEDGTQTFEYMIG